MRRFPLACALLTFVLALGCGGPTAPSKTVSQTGGGDPSKPAATSPDKTGKADAKDSVEPHESKTHGALQVKVANPRTGDWFMVEQDGKALPGNPPLLNSTIELAPGAYVAVVNRSRRNVTIEAGKKTILWTGEVVVEGKGADWYIPYQGKERMLVSNPPILGSPTALFPGDYSVYVYVELMEKKLGDATVVAGRKTVLKY